MARADLAAELARVEQAALARGPRFRGLGTVTPITSLTPDQQNQTTALMAVAWALLEAESRGDRSGATSLVPVFVSSYNAWNAGVRRIYANAPASLSPTAAWGTPMDTALTLTIATYAWMQQRTDEQIHSLLGSFPTGAPPNAFRGTWFMTQVAPQFAAALFDHAVMVFRTGGGAEGLLSWSDSVSRGSDPRAASTTPAPPRTPAVTTPTTHQAVELPGMTITASSPSPRSITWPWYALGGAIAIGIGVYGYQRIKRGSK